MGESGFTAWTTMLSQGKNAGIADVPLEEMCHCVAENMKSVRCVCGFTSDIEGNFGGVWDRGGLVAINKDDQQK